MAGLTTSTLSSNLLKIAQMQAQQTVLSAPLFHSIDGYNVKGVSKLVIPNYSAPTVYAPNENEAGTISSLSVTGVEIPSVRYWAGEKISNQSINGSTEDQLALRVGEKMGRAMVEKTNQLIFSMFNGFGQVIGDSTAAITVGNVITGEEYLQANNAPGPYFLAMTPYVFADLKNDVLENYGIGSVLGNAVMTNTFNSLGNVQFLIVSDLVAGTSEGQASAPSIKCGMYSRYALAANFFEDINIKSQQNILTDSEDMVAQMYFGVAEINDGFGVEFNVKNKD